MALSSSSARLASSPVSFRNPGAGGCVSFGDVVWAVVGEPGIAIPNPISSPNRNTTRRAFMMGLILSDHCGRVRVDTDFPGLDEDHSRSLTGLRHPLPGEQAVDKACIHGRARGRLDRERFEGHGIDARQAAQPARQLRGRLAGVAGLGALAAGAGGVVGQKGLEDPGRRRARRPPARTAAWRPTPSARCASSTRDTSGSGSRDTTSAKAYRPVPSLRRYRSSLFAGGGYCGCCFLAGGVSSSSGSQSSSVPSGRKAIRYE